jgi:single-strand DNA-binding protein
MADGMNKVLLLGNLGADPELRMTQGGQAVLKIRMATSETYFDRNKVKQERTEWHAVVVWGKRAEGLAKILEKGSRILVEGGLRTSSWDDKDGVKRYKTEVHASNILLCGGNRGGGSGGGKSGGGGRAGDDDQDDRGSGGYDDSDYGGGSDGDIPF